MKKDSKQDQTDITPISEAGKLAVLASAITTIGFGLGTIADALALEETALEKQEKQQKQQQQTSTSEIARLEQKIDQLMYEMKQMRKQMR